MTNLQPPYPPDNDQYTYVLLPPRKPSKQLWLVSIHYPPDDHAYSGLRERPVALRFGAHDATHCLDAHGQWHPLSDARLPPDPRNGNHLLTKKEIRSVTYDYRQARKARRKAVRKEIAADRARRLANPPD